MVPPWKYDFRIILTIHSFLNHTTCFMSDPIIVIKVRHIEKEICEKTPIGNWNFFLKSRFSACSGSSFLFIYYCNIKMDWRRARKKEQQKNLILSHYQPTRQTPLPFPPSSFAYLESFSFSLAVYHNIPRSNI